jgi:hypothetical protein
MATGSQMPFLAWSGMELYRPKTDAVAGQAP